MAVPTSTSTTGSTMTGQRRSEDYAGVVTAGAAGSRKRKHQHSGGRAVNAALTRDVSPEAMHSVSHSFPGTTRSTGRILGAQTMGPTLLHKTVAWGKQGRVNRLRKRSAIAVPLVSNRLWLLIALMSAWGCGGKAVAAAVTNGEDVRNLQIAGPPEEDVTATPTNFPTFSPSTLAPTLAPVAQPTVSPSPPPTNFPTAVPSPSPSRLPTRRPTALPTSLPTVAPTASPSQAPTGRPTTPQPSAAPTLQPSWSPLATGETRQPSLEPTSAPTRLPSIQPSFNPSDLPIFETPTPQGSEEETTVPTLTVWEEFVIEESRRVFLELPSTQRASPRGLASVWQDYMQSTLELVYNNRNDLVRLKNATVLVDGEGAPSNNRRHLQSAEDETYIQMFQVDTQIFLEKNAAQSGETTNGQVEQLVENLLTQENLQQSLEDANVQGVRVAGVEEPEEVVRSKKPTLVELVIGFALLGIAVAALAATTYSRVKSIRKRRRKKRLKKLRESNSYVMPRQERAKPVSPSRSIKSKGEVFVEEDTLEQGATYLDDESDPSPTNLLSDDSSGVSDPFARELQHAAVMDDAAWRQLQRKKESLQRKGRVANSMYSTAAGSGEEGVEIGTGLRNFPYGVDTEHLARKTSSGATSPETASSYAPGIPLSPEDAVPWTTSGMTLNIVGREPSLTQSSSFEPYGDSSRRPTSLQESWDLDETPQDEPGQYSFMAPLRPRSSETENARTSPTSFSEDPSTAALRNSPSVSSWSEVEGEMRASPVESMAPLGMIRENLSDSTTEQDKGKDASFATVDMLQEVQRLSAYVKRYEKKKEIQRSLGASTGGGSSVSYDHMSDSVSAQRMGRSPQESSVSRGGQRRLGKTNYRQAAGLTTSMESSGFGTMESSSELSGASDSDEDVASTRLGINRFSIQDPSKAGLLYSVEELPMPSLASPEESGALLSSPERQMDIRDIAGPMAPGKPMERYSPTEDIAPDDETKGNLGGTRAFYGSRRGLEDKVGKIGRGKGKLSKLRGNGNMLDGEEPSDHTYSTAPSDEVTRDEKKEAAVRRPSPPPVRSTNRGFTNIISMFESKPKTPIAPPNANWQPGVQDSTNSKK